MHSTLALLFSQEVWTLSIYIGMSPSLPFLKFPTVTQNFDKGITLSATSPFIFPNVWLTYIVVYCCYIYSCIFFFCLTNSCWFSSSFLTGSVFSGLGRFSKMTFLISSISFFGIFFSEFTLTYVGLSCGVGD